MYNSLNKFNIISLIPLQKYIITVTNTNKKIYQI